MPATHLREAIRSLRRDPLFASVAVGLLAVSIGAVMAVHAVVHAVILRPLPFADQERLVVIWQRDDRRALPVVEIAYGEMLDWRARASHVLEDLAVVGSTNWSLELIGRDGNESLALAPVSASFFSVAGTSPAIGRALEPSDEDGPIPHAMVISHGLWMRRFGADARIVGQSVPVRLAPDTPPVDMTITGVMPRDFDYPRHADVWVPAAPLIRGAGERFGGEATTMRWLRVFYAFGKLRQGIEREEAERELTLVMRTADRQGGPEPNERLIVTPVAHYVVGPARPVLWALLAGAALMLLITCANVAGLQVSRMARRQRAQAVRLALGASTGRLMGTMLVEGALLTVFALCGAVVSAAAVSRALLALAPSGVPRLDAVTYVEPTLLAVAAGAALVTLVVCGVTPSLAQRRVSATAVLAHGAGVATDTRARRTQRVVVLAQVAIALVLLAGSVLFLRTVHRLDRTVLGFDPNRLLAVTVSSPIADADRMNSFLSALIERVETWPGVLAAGAVATRPLSGPIGWDTQPLYPGQLPDDPCTWGLNPYVNVQTVTPGYFDAMGVRVRRGRHFTETDRASSPGVVLVGMRAAERLWPGQDPIGQRLRDMSYRHDGPATAEIWQTVIGVVDDVRYRGLNDVRLDMYLPAAQSMHRLQHLMIRTRGDGTGLVDAVRTAAIDLEPGASVAAATWMRDVVAAESAPWRFLMRTFLAFAGLAGALAAIGLGTVVALAVTTRRHELAIRAALGADRRRLRAIVLRDVVRLVAGGVLLGLALVLMSGRLTRHLLVGVEAHDPLSLSVAVLGVVLVAVAAMWLPARRAGRTNPAEALRAE